MLVYNRTTGVALNPQAGHRRRRFDRLRHLLTLNQHQKVIWIPKVGGPGNHWCAGYLPADASQDNLSSPHANLSALINAINHVPGLGLPVYATDINRSGATTGADILGLIDLLLGADAFDYWIARGLPDCPSAP